MITLSPDGTADHRSHRDQSRENEQQTQSPLPMHREFSRVKQFVIDIASSSLVASGVLPYRGHHLPIEPLAPTLGQL